MNQINKEIGAWLLISGNTQSLLAKKLGMSRPTLITRIKSPETWSLGEVKKLAEIVGFDADKLIP